MRATSIAESVVFDCVYRFEEFLQEAVNTIIDIVESKVWHAVAQIGNKAVLILRGNFFTFVKKQIITVRQSAAAFFHAEIILNEKSQIHTFGHGNFEMLAEICRASRDAI